MPPSSSAASARSNLIARAASKMSATASLPIAFDLNSICFAHDQPILSADSSKRNKSVAAFYICPYIVHEKPIL